MHDLGYIFSSGEGVKQDHVEAVRWYRKGADQDDAYSQASLGFSYRNGEGVKQDHVEAVRWYRMAAE